MKQRDILLEALRRTSYHGLYGSQVELGEWLKVSPSCISRWLSGANNIPLHTLTLLRLIAMGKKRLVKEMVNGASLAEKANK